MLAYKGIPSFVLPQRSVYVETAAQFYGRNACHRIRPQRRSAAARSEAQTGVLHSHIDRTGREIAIADAESVAEKELLRFRGRTLALQLELLIGCAE